LGGSGGVFAQAATDAKTISELKEALRLIWSALPQKVSENGLKDFRKRLQACVSANHAHFGHKI